MKKSVMLIVLTLCLAPAAFSAQIWRPTPVVRLLDAQSSAQELQSIMEAVYSVGKYSNRDLSKRTFQTMVRGLALTNQLTFTHMHDYHAYGPTDLVTRITVVTEARSPALVVHSLEFKRLTVGLSQGKGKWWKAVIEPVYETATVPPQLHNASLLRVSVGKLFIHGNVTLTSMYRNSVISALKIAGYAAGHVR